MSKESPLKSDILSGIKLLLIDDHVLFTEALTDLLKNEGAESIFSCKSIDELYSIPDNFRPDIILLDVNLQGKNALDYLATIKSKFKCPILVLTGHNVRSFWNKERIKDINGVFFKTENSGKLLKAINKILHGHFFFHLEACQDSNQIKSDPNLKDAFGSMVTLTPREKETLKLICDGKSVEQIGKELYLSKHTVIVHRRNLYKKFAVNSLVGLYAKAHSLNIDKSL